jgi:indolepyruvate ferredoxin oxidoreductase, beta subunit
MTTRVKSILLAGVGGQGIVRASDIISMALMASGFDVKKSEVHGMAQRGGCVTSHVRYGEKVYSPIAKKGDIDILVSFEKIETLRYLDYMAPEGRIIINDEEIYPPSVNLGRNVYPENVVEMVHRYFEHTKVLKASDIAAQVGNSRTVNSVMIGALSCHLEITTVVWERVYQTAFPEKMLKDNIEAFHLGRKA